jgi:hypothetical protein
VSQTVNNPWESAPTATRTFGGVTVNAVMTGIADTRTETILDNGRAPRTTSVHTDFDPVYGEPVDVQDNGDDAVTGDETCTLTSYDRATSSDGSTWLVDFPSRVQKFATTCATAQAGGLTAAQVISDTLTYYDGATSTSTPPTHGLVTRTDELKDWVNGAPVYQTAAQSVYDTVGRVISSTDVRGNTTGSSASTRCSKRAYRSVSTATPTAPTTRSAQPTHREPTPTDRPSTGFSTATPTASTLTASISPSASTITFCAAAAARLPSASATKTVRKAGTAPLTT